MQATFEVEQVQTKLILSADVPYDVIDAIVRVTRAHGNDERLEWDINNVPHHSSYTSLAEDKGKVETKPGERLAWLYEEQGQAGGLLVSTSWPIPAEDNKDPPHREAANYYRRVAGDVGGSFVVTMCHPSESAPQPLTIEIGTSGYKIFKSAGGSAAIISGVTPRAGRAAS